HHHLAELEAGDLLLRALVELDLDVRHHVVHRLHTHRPLLAGLEDGTPELLTIERLTSPVALDHVGQHVLDVLVRRVAPVAPETLPPPPDELALAAHARIDHAVLGVAAERALHRRRSA